MTDGIIKLRELTGAGILDCKRALEEAEGDVERAAVIIRERGLIKAEKKAGRQTGAGLLESYIHNNRIGVLLELRAETDFAVRSDALRMLARELAMQIAALDAASVAALLEQPYIKDESLMVAQLIKNTIAQVGENIQVERFCRYEL